MVNDLSNEEEWVAFEEDMEADTAAWDRRTAWAKKRQEDQERLMAHTRSS